LSAGETCLGEELSYNKKTFYGAGDILIKEKNIQKIRDYFSPGGFFMGRYFNVTPAAVSLYSSSSMADDRRCSQ